MEVIPHTQSTHSSGRSYTPPPALAAGRPDRRFLPPYRRPCSPVIQCLIFLVVAAAVFAGIVAFLAYYLRPRAPTLQITTATICPLDVLSGSQVTAVCYVNFLITNPNERASIGYEHVVGFLYYGETLVSWADMPSLHLAKRDNGSMPGVIRATSVHVESHVAEAMLNDRETGVVAFNFKMHARVRFFPTSVVAMSRWMTGSCDNVALRFLPGSVAGAILIDRGAKVNGADMKNLKGLMEKVARNYDIETYNLKV